jgi:hypothetical protein
MQMLWAAFENVRGERVTEGKARYAFIEVAFPAALS